MSISIINGKSSLVRAIFRDSQGNIVPPCATVAWTTSASGVATVAVLNNKTDRLRAYFGEKALITAVTSGTATITATSQDANASTITATISVTAYNNVVASVEIDAEV